MTPCSMSGGLLHSRSGNGSEGAFEKLFAAELTEAKISNVKTVSIGRNEISRKIKLLFLFKSVLE